MKDFYSTAMVNSSSRKSHGLNCITNEPNQTKVSGIFSGVVVVTAILSMLVGGIIYVLWRSDTLVMFIWLDKLGLKDEVYMLRNYVKASINMSPAWIYLSLPQSLWFLSGLLAFSMIWKSDMLQKTYWIVGFGIASIGFEIGQYFEFVPGTYDVVDLLLLVGAFIVALLIESLYLFIERK